MYQRQLIVPVSGLQIKLSVSVVFLLCLFIAILLSIFTGAINLSLLDFLTGTSTEMQSIVLFQIRLPRVFAAGIVGAGLAISGAAMQGLFRNPLADPGLIGVSAGAALAVALVIVLVGNLPGLLGVYSLSIAAFLGGLIASLIIFRLAAFSGSFSVTYLLLAGIATNALAMAGTGFLTFLSDDQQLRAFTFWTIGSVGGAMWPAVICSASIILPATYVLTKNARALNVLMLGEGEAKSLGVETKRLKYTVIICAALCVGAAVSISGLIGFIGLLVPHLIRLMVGSDHRRLIPFSAILGATLLIIADTVARTILTPTEVPVGILTSLIGGPFFLWLLAKQFSNRYGL